MVSLFAGCGGSSLGYSIAGFRELLAVDNDAHAVGVFRANLPGVPVWQGDIAKLDPGMLDVPPGGLDVLDGSPPCQGVSMFGRRQLDDPRNQLFRQFVRLLAVWQPRAMVLENVAGLASGKMAGLFTEILSELTGAGYVVAARLVNAAQLGVPQSRKRVIIVGVRADLAAAGSAPVHPRPVGRPVTLRAALNGLDGPGLFDVPMGKGAVIAALTAPGSTGARALTIRGGRAVHFSCVRLAWDRPSNTIVKDVRPGTGSGYLHPSELRFMGVRELARIQSFPDQFCWGDGTYKKIHARIGNSVPPLMMAAVAATVRDGVLRASVPA